MEEEEAFDWLEVVVICETVVIVLAVVLLPKTVADEVMLVMALVDTYCAGGESAVV